MTTKLVKEFIEKTTLDDGTIQEKTNKIIFHRIIGTSLTITAS